MKGKKIAIALLAIFFVATIAPLMSYAQEEEVPYGAWVDQISFQAESDQAKVLNMLENNEVQLHISDINDPDVFNNIRESPNVDYAMSYGLFFDLTFNPSGPTFPATGKFNPFSNPKIREAMNWLVDRAYIADELMGGLAKPKFLPIVSAFPDYGKLADVFKELEATYSPDFERAKTAIFQEMSDMGAEFVEGKWYYNDEHVTLKMLIRIDSPPRTRIGDYVSNMLEDLGFATDRMYRTSPEASPLWLWGNPDDGEWHVYTGGWITTVVVRDYGDTYSFHYTPRGMWASPLSAAYTPDPIFQEIAYRLDDADWATWDERMDLMAKAAQLSFEDSVKVWLVDQTTPFPFRNEIQVANDLAAGLFSSPISAWTIRYKDQVGGTIKASDREVIVDPWNPISGSNWAYDAHIALCTGAREYIFNPYTGLPMAHEFESATVDVLEGAQVFSTEDWCTLNFVDEIAVPTDAWYEWDYENQEIVTAPAGTTARAKVTIDYGDVIGNVKYHDGSVMSKADWVAMWPLDFERNNPDSPLYDASSAPAYGSFRTEFQGLRITSWSPLILEIYLDFSTLDAELILAEAVALTNIDMPIDGFDTFWPSMPWHAKAIGVLAEEQGLLAWTMMKSDSEELEWMNYLGGPSLAVLEDMLTEAENTEFVPFADFASEYVEPGEAAERYANLRQWYEDRGHFWVADGQFYLDSVDFVGHSAVVKAFGENRHKADKYAFLAEPPIPESSVTPPDNVVPGLEAEFTLSLSTMGQPYANDRIDFVKYVFLDTAGTVLAKGDATPVAEGEWAIGLTDTETAGMTAGTYSLLTIALSKDVALPGIVETPFVVIPELSYIKSLLAQTEAEMNAAISALESTVETTIEDEISGLRGAVSASQTIMYASIGLALVAVVIAIYAVIAKK